MKLMPCLGTPLSLGGVARLGPARMFVFSHFELELLGNGCQVFKFRETLVFLAQQKTRYAADQTYAKFCKPMDEIVPF